MIVKFVYNSIFTLFISNFFLFFSLNSGSNSSESFIKIIHRSTIKCEDENTIKGFLKAKDLYSEQNTLFEIDLQITFDNNIILFHDANYKKIVIKDSKLNELKKIIPNLTTFEDLLKMAPSNNFILDIRIDPKFANTTKKDIKKLSLKKKLIFLNKLSEIINKYNENKYYVFVEDKVIYRHLKNQNNEIIYMVPERYFRKFDSLSYKNLLDTKKKFGTNIFALDYPKLNKISLEDIKNLDLDIMLTTHTDFKNFEKIKYWLRLCD